MGPHLSVEEWETRDDCVYLDLRAWVSWLVGFPFTTKEGTSSSCCQEQGRPSPPLRRSLGCLTDLSEYFISFYVKQQDFLWFKTSRKAYKYEYLPVDNPGSNLHQEETDT